MIPNLSFDRDFVRKHWSTCTEDEVDDIAKYADSIKLTDDCEFYIHPSDNMWVELGIYKEFKNIKRSSVEYGYCSTQKALAKYLKKYAYVPDKNYYVY